MPQLTPVFFSNETTCAIAIVLFILYLLTKYVLPYYTRNGWALGTLV